MLDRNGWIYEGRRAFRAYMEGKDWSRETTVSTRHSLLTPVFSPTRSDRQTTAVIDLEPP